MPDLVISLGFVALAYLVGSIPFPLLIGRVKGVDLRKVGSHNVGAGNLTRNAGWPAGFAGAVLDGYKGILPFMVGPLAGVGSGTVGAAALAAVAGHNWSLYLRGHGGRGLATSTGVILGLNPALAIWPAVWSVAGWKIGGGFAGFIGWGLLPVFAVIAPFSPVEVSVAAGLSLMMMVRRAQGGEQRDPGLDAMVRRVIFDRNPSDRAREITSGGDTEHPVRT